LKYNTFEKTNGDYVLHDDLTMKGVIKPIKLDVEFGGIIKDPWGNEKGAPDDSEDSIR